MSREHPFVNILIEDKIRNAIFLELELFEAARLEEVSRLVFSLTSMAYSALLTRDFPLSAEYGLAVEGVVDSKSLYRHCCQQSVVNGLRIWAEPSVVELAEGQISIIKVVLTNETDEEMSLEVGNSRVGNFLENGAAFALSVPSVSSKYIRPHRNLNVSEVMEGSEEGEVVPILVRLARRSSLTYFAKAKLSRRAMLDYEAAAQSVRAEKLVKPTLASPHMEPTYGFLSPQGYDYLATLPPSMKQTDTVEHLVQVRLHIKRTDAQRGALWEDWERKKGEGDYLPVPTTAALCTPNTEQIAPGSLWWGESRSNVMPLLVRYDLSAYPEDPGRLGDDDEWGVDITSGEADLYGEVF